VHSVLQIIAYHFTFSFDSALCKWEVNITQAIPTAQDLENFIQSCATTFWVVITNTNSNTRKEINSTEPNVEMHILFRCRM